MGTKLKNIEMFQKKEDIGRMNIELEAINHILMTTTRIILKNKKSQRFDDSTKVFERVEEESDIWSVIEIKVLYELIEILVWWGSKYCETLNPETKGGFKIQGDNPWLRFNSSFLVKVSQSTDLSQLPSHV